MAATCTINTRGRSWNPKVIKEFDECLDLFVDTLAEAGISTGDFTLEVIEGTRGSAQRKGVTVCRDDGILAIQPGSNDSAWKFQLRIPPSSTMAEVLAALKAVREKKLDKLAREPAKPAAPAQESERLPEGICEDYDTLALASYGAFTYVNEPITLDRWNNCVQKALGYSFDLIAQLTQALMNRKILKQSMFCGELCVGLLPSTFADFLVEHKFVALHPPAKAVGPEIVVESPKAAARKEDVLKEVDGAGQTRPADEERLQGRTQATAPKARTDSERSDPQGRSDSRASGRAACARRWPHRGRGNAPRAAGPDPADSRASHRSGGRGGRTARSGSEVT